LEEHVETLVGFAFGFFLGTREGKEGIAKLRESWAAIKESADVKHLVGEGVTALGPIMREVAKVTGGAA
jgi:hypothetical protein